MAETAILGVARTVVGSVLSKASSAAAEKASLLLGVRQEIWFIKHELLMIEAFLLAADASQEKNPVVKAWVKQVRDLAYDIQDCLEEFDVYVNRNSMLRRMMKLGTRHRIAMEIRNMKARVEEVSKSSLRYNLITTSPSISEDTARTVEFMRQVSPLNIEESELVGMEGPKKVVLGLITALDQELRVISIVGMGGLGKTVLAKKVYESTDLGSDFTCRVWVTVSQSFDPMSLFKDMLKQLVGEQESLSQSSQEVIQRIKDALKEKRYVLVFDDLWSTNSWNCIKPVWSEYNNKGSRIIVTTRDVALANHCSSSPSLVHNLDTLSRDDSLALLLKKIRKSHEDLKKCEELKEHSEEILRKCGGLPLAIVTIGGLLCTRPIKEWKMLYARLPSELAINPSLEALKRVVILGYNYLPYYLKPCLLYLAVFPEDFEIKKTCLVNRWIAEGFIIEEDGATIEEVAEDYFFQLISRSMIQPSRSNLRGEVKSIQLHDITRDVILAISKEENLVFCIKEHSTIASAGNFRHITFHLDEILSCPLRVDLRRVRSLTVFERPVEPLSSLCSVQLRMLRVVALENARFKITQQDLSNIGLLCHLRYLSVYNSYVYALPKSLGNLQSLQTLDIRQTYITSLPAEISRLQTLRNLIFSRSALSSFDRDDPIVCFVLILLPVYFCVVPEEDRAKVMATFRATLSSPTRFSSAVKVPKNIGSLKHLQRLEIVDIQQSGGTVIKELVKLTQLRKLKVTGITDKYWMKFCNILPNLSSLRSLRMCKEGQNEEHIPSESESDSHVSLSPPPLLESLSFEGHLRILPTWFTRFDKLCKINLIGTELVEGEVIKILNGSPNLIRLRLLHNSYVGNELTFRGGTFAKLKMLEIDDLKKLEGITFGEEALPQLETISIDWCQLKAGISGVKHLPKLKKIILHGYCRMHGLDMLEMEIANHPTRPCPTLQMVMDRRFHDLD